MWRQVSGVAPRRPVAALPSTSNTSLARTHSFTRVRSVPTASHALYLSSHMNPVAKRRAPLCN